MLISDVMVAMELACRDRSDVRLLSLKEHQTRAQRANRREPFQWSVKIGPRQKCGVIPDRVFGLEFTGADGGKSEAWFALEADRGTMPVMRRGLAQSSFYRKLLAYEATWSQEIHRREFGWHRFRVLTVTASAERAKHLLESATALKRGRGLFLFTDASSLLAESPLALIGKSATSDQPTSPLI